MSNNVMAEKEIVTEQNNNQFR